MSEADIENQFVDHVKSLGYLALKLRIDGQNGWPDRTVITDRGVMFFEFKTPQGRLSAAQGRWMRSLRRLGYKTDTATSLNQAKAALRRFLKGD